EPRCIDLHGAVASVGQLLGRVVGEHIQVVIESTGPGTHVLIDPGQLDQVLMNLSVNAKDAMPNGGALTFSLRTERTAPPMLVEGDYAVLSVRDTGVGMDEGVRRQVFEPFFTTKGELGTGLGLATCYGIIKQAGGHVEVVSQIGAGTC